jgi:hypothetical protein
MVDEETGKFVHKLAPKRAVKAQLKTPLTFSVYECPEDLGFAWSS